MTAICANFLLELIQFVFLDCRIDPSNKNPQGRASVCEEPQCRSDESLTTDVDMFQEAQGQGRMPDNVVLMLSTHREPKTFLAMADFMQ